MFAEWTAGATVKEAVMNKMLILSALSLVAAGPALAASPPPSETVSYRDLDLTRPEGRAMLDRRIERAIRGLCSPQVGRDTFYDFTEGRRCARLARAEARHGAELAVAGALRAAGQVQLAIR
jgi:UrcA family protein